MRREIGRWLLCLVSCAFGCGGGGDGGGPEDAGPGCGDGIQQEGEECDNGTANSDTEPGACRTTCRLAFCGDGVVDSGEDCDDGSANSDTAANACRADCEDPTCGDSVVDDGEACDDGRDNSDDDADACRETCEEASCGDGVADTGEACDDGDTIETDECRNDCTSPAIWTVIDDLGGMGGIASDVAVDANDDFVVVGSTLGASTGVDVWVRKYDEGGTTLWTRTYDGGTDYDVGAGVAVDAAGNVLATGLQTAASGDYDVVVLKYDPDGNPLWTQTYDGPGSGDDNGVRIAADSAGNAFVVGTETAAGGDADVWVRKYDASGGIVWTNSIDEAGEDDIAYGIAVDPSDNVLVVETLTPAGGTTSEDVVQKYDNDGGPLWAATYPSTDMPFDFVWAVTSDAAGNVLVGGTEFTSVAGGWAAKLDPGGADVWSMQHQPAADDDFEVGYDIAVDGDGNVLVGGVAAHSDNTVDMLVLKYDSSGTEVWSRPIDVDEVDDARGIAADSTGAVIVVGTTYDSSGAPSVLVRKYEP